MANNQPLDLSSLENWLWETLVLSSWVEEEQQEQDRGAWQDIDD